MDSLEYDNIGRINKKQLHGGIQSIEYSYNLKNQIKSISSQKFSQSLYYENPPNSNNGLYNGSISANIYGSGIENQYYYSYDQLNRLIGASNGSENKFGEFVTGFDKNSNTLGINRNGYVFDYGYNVTHGAIDDLTMVYSGNQLKNVSDAANQQSVISTNDFYDVQNSNPVEYLYDNIGNQSSDLNRGIAWTRYNILNLPEKVQFRNGTKNEYVYDATGVKRSAGYNYSTNTSLIPLGDTDPQKENTASSTYRIDYCGNYIYEKQGTMPPRLRRILTPEGYIQTYGGLMSHQGYWKYIYNLKDYQGNTRVFLSSDYISNTNSLSYTFSDQIDYYPFGMERSNTGQTGQSSGSVFNSADNPYLYSGNETDRINGLNLNDFNARWLSAAIPGFTTQDPLGEYHYSENPYSYCGSDPVNRVDPLGLDWWYNKEGDIPEWYGIMEESEAKKKYKFHKKEMKMKINQTMFHFKDDGSIEAILPEFIISLGGSYYNDLNYLLYGWNGSQNEESEEVSDTYFQEIKYNNNFKTPEFNTTIYKGVDFVYTGLKLSLFSKNKILQKNDIKITNTYDIKGNKLSTSYGPFSVSTDGSYGLGILGLNMQTGNFSISQEVHIPFTTVNYGAKVTFNINDLSKIGYGLVFFIVENPYLIAL